MSSRPPTLAEAEAALARLHGGGRLDERDRALLDRASERLIVYGSLAPGGPHHGELDAITGTWRRGWVTGRLVERGWGAALGYPALAWDPGGARVRAYLLESARLKAHWSRLDELEGEEYRRIAVPFLPEDGEWLVGLVYALRPG